MNLEEIKEHIINCGYKYEYNNVFHKNKQTKLSNYADNFGIQWNIFQKTQFDSFTGLDQTEERLKKCSNWDFDNLKEKLILELGSGAGRFTEIFVKYGAIIISVELSSAAYANAKNNQCDSLFIIRESLLELNLGTLKFDYVFSYGVAQHVPDALKVYETATHFLKKEKGLLSIDHYLKRLPRYIPCFLYNSKYLWRPITKNIPPKTLYKILKIFVSIYLPFDIFIKKIFPYKIYRLIRLIIPIPIFNYYKSSAQGYKVKQDYESLYEWSLMDTFDALSAKYDEPWTLHTMQKVAKHLRLSKYSIKIVRKNGNGLVLNGIGK